jgi:hypothetical protein
VVFADAERPAATFPAPDGPAPGGGEMACSGRPGRRTGQGEMVMLPDSVAWFPALSVTLMVNLDVPAIVGVPLR